MKRCTLTVFMIALFVNNNSIFAQVASRFDVLITEIFADASPSFGLPPNEFVEIKNVSASSYNLKDWKLSDGSSTATISINYVLQPDSLVIICMNSAVSNFSSFGNAIGVANFPSLDNDEDLIFLLSKDGITLHAVKYNKSWYQNDLKANGGWTLEMFDTKNPCAGINNWKASIDPKGGTPGKNNSVNGINKDDMPPSLVRAFAIDSVTVIAVFDETVDSLAASFASRYRLDKNIDKAVHAIPVRPLFTEVVLIFSNPLAVNTIYTLIVSEITDCAGNVINTNNQSNTGLSSTADTFDVVINEIFFNPKSDGFDFVELYNKSKKIVDLQHLYIANRNSTGVLDNIKQLSVIPYLFFPGDYIVITENTRWLSQNYSVKNIDNLLQLPTLPSFPDDKGTIIVANQQGKIIEEILYDSKWHFALLNSHEGISLERIDYSAPTQNKNNWGSAASTAGFATPGYQNSQFMADPQMNGMILVNPTIFSPDNDGFDDRATISYQIATPGHVANMTIFDASGRLVRYLVKNATLGLQGNFRWDGLDDKMQQLPVGIYIVFTEVFNLRGKTKKFKNVVTLARKF
ncbi:MAG: lamin tail domain-containing protein [Chitinophagaceae bacterium]|nr:lamin tail domain-containing protein [Chitinophagaceae bacterium]